MKTVKKIMMFLLIIFLSSSFLKLKAEDAPLEVFYFNDQYQTDEIEMELYDLDENLLLSFSKEEYLFEGVLWHRFWTDEYDLTNIDYLLKITISDVLEPLFYNFTFDEMVNVYYLKDDVFYHSINHLKTTISYATFINRREIRFFANDIVSSEQFRLLKGDVFVEDYELKNFHPQYIVTLEEDFDFTSDYYLEVETKGFLPCITYVRHDEIYKEGFFKTLFKYDESDLGAVYSTTSTVFKVWAPTLGSISLNLYNLKNEKESYEMEKDIYGVFSFRKIGNLKNYEYSFSFTRDYKEYEIVDPYAKYISDNGLGLIIDLNSTNPTNFKTWKPNLPSKNFADFVIYESSIERLTNQFGKSNLVNTYSGLAETNLTIYDGVYYPIGLDYLKELGVTHLTLSNLLNTENSLSVINRFYSSSTDYTFEIKELKQMIKTLGDNGIGVILDLNVYQKTISSLEDLLPGYYYESNLGNVISNDEKSFFETNNFMTNNFLESQILYLISEFKFSGLKISPLNSLNIDYLNNELRQIVSNNDFLIYGEFSNNNPNITNKKLTSKTLDQARHVGFVDEDRFLVSDDFITSTGNNSLKGYILSAWNSTYSTLSPEQSFKRLNYFSNLSKNANLQIKSIQLLSYGVIVLKGGEEIGLYNEEPLDYSNQKSNYDLLNMYKKLIAFRKEHPSLKMFDHNILKNEVVYNIKNDVVTYQIVNANDLYPDILIIHNFGDNTSFTLPEGLKGFLHYNRDGEFNWQLVYDNLNEYQIGEKFENNSSLNLQKNQSVVLHFGLNKENIIEDPIKSPEPPDNPNIIYYLLFGGGAIIIGGIIITYFILKPSKKDKQFK